MTFNLATMLRETTVATPDKVFAHFPDSSLTFGELDAAATRFANGLRARGVRPGQSVAVQLPNVPEFLIAYFGTLKSGAVFVPLNPLLTAPEVEYHLSDSQSTLLVSHILFAKSAAAACQALSVPLFVVGTAHAPDSGLTDFADILGDSDVDPVLGDIHPSKPEDIALIIYTSGTTGRPKGAMLSHIALFNGIDISSRSFGLEADDVALAALPWFHVFGLCSVVNAATRCGSSVVALPRFEVEPVMDAIEKYGVTVFPGVPTMFAALLTDTKERDLSKLRVAISGGASMPGAILEKFEEKFPNLWVMEGYGMSETGAVATQNPSREDRKVLSIGKPMWGADIRIVDKEDRELPRGPEHVGELVMRSICLMTGYLGRPEATEEAFANGWFHTGDLGYRDDDGFFYIVDRSKDLIIRGGYNVYPREIEEVLFAHPKVAESAVIGKHDERLGEEVVAIVSLHAGEEMTEAEVIEYCKTQLAAYKYPREVRFRAELPKNATGKILKTELRD